VTTDTHAQHIPVCTSVIHVHRNHEYSPRSKYAIRLNCQLDNRAIVAIGYSQSKLLIKHPS